MKKKVYSRIQLARCSELAAKMVDLKMDNTEDPTALALFRAEYNHHMSMARRLRRFAHVMPEVTVVR